MGERGGGPSTLLIATRWETKESIPLPVRGQDDAPIEGGLWHGWGKGRRVKAVFPLTIRQRWGKKKVTGHRRQTCCN